MNHSGKVYLRYFIPFIIYAIAATIIAALVIPIHKDNFSILLPAFYAFLMVGYIVYFVSLRFVVYQITRGEKYFHLAYHLPYLFFLIPAALAGYFVIRIFLNQTFILSFAFGLSLIIMGLFYYWGIFLVTKTLESQALVFRLIHFLPLLVFLVFATAVSFILIPIAKNNLYFLWLAYAISLFFAVIVFLLGQAMTYLSFKGSRISFKLYYFLPLAMYLILALGLAFWIIPNSVGKTHFLFFGYGTSLWGGALFYFLMVNLLLYDFSKTGHAN